MVLRVLCGIQFERQTVRVFANTSARLRVRHRCAMTRNVTRTKIAIKPQLR